MSSNYYCLHCQHPMAVRGEGTRCYCANCGVVFVFQDGAWKYAMQTSGNNSIREFLYLEDIIECQNKSK